MYPACDDTDETPDDPSSVRCRQPDPATFGTLPPSKLRYPEPAVAYLLATIDAFDTTKNLEAHQILLGHVRAHLAALATHLDRVF